MISILIRENQYQDSVTLMLLSNFLSDIEGVSSASVMMGTPANRDIFKNTGFVHPKMAEAKASDIIMAIKSDLDVTELVNEKIDEFLKSQAQKSRSTKVPKKYSWRTATRVLPDANLALLSIPGPYVYEEAKKAIELGLHVFIFSDNISVEEERSLKDMASKKGLLVMGPDCGTGCISGVPIAFANVVNEGNIGVVGASGTGIQEVITQIHHLGSGITHAIGTGGRDLKESIGGITVKQALGLLEKDEKTKVVVLISKPPAESVKAEVVAQIKAMSKPVVILFIGDLPKANDGNICYAYTLEEAAYKAVERSKLCRLQNESLAGKIEAIKAKPAQRKIKALYSGGTLAYECGFLVENTLGLPHGSNTQEGYILSYGGHEVIDLGDDAYTQGRPHPMIDSRLRIEMMTEMAKKDETAILLFDVVLGYGSGETIAQDLLKGIRSVQKTAKEKGKEIILVATVCGTDEDPQGMQQQIKILEDAGVFVHTGNAKAVVFVLDILRQLDAEVCGRGEATASLLAAKPSVINIGLPGFAVAAKRYGANVVQYEWKPKRQLSSELASALAALGASKG